MTKSQKPKNNFFKKNWHIIVIVILFLFGMGQCTRSCSRNQSIHTQTEEIMKKDSIINSLEMTIDTLKNNVNYYTALFESERNHNSNFASIATGNQAELYGQINNLIERNTTLEKENTSLKDKVNSLEKENKELKETISSLSKE